VDFLYLVTYFIRICKTLSNFHFLVRFNRLLFSSLYVINIVIFTRDVRYRLTIWENRYVLNVKYFIFVIPLLFEMEYSIYFFGIFKSEWIIFYDERIK